MRRWLSFRRIRHRIIYRLAKLLLVTALFVEPAADDLSNDKGPRKRLQNKCRAFYALRRDDTLILRPTCRDYVKVATLKKSCLEGFQNWIVGPFSDKTAHTTWPADVISDAVTTTFAMSCGKRCWHAHSWSRHLHQISHVWEIFNNIGDIRLLQNGVSVQ